MQKQRTGVAVALLASGVVVLVVLLGGSGGWRLGPTTVILLAAMVAMYAAAAGVRRTLAAGKLDLFHPLIFPTIYVAVASLAPVAWLWLWGEDLGYVTRSFMSPRTPLLMALATVGFALGAAIPFPHPRARSKPIDPAVLGGTGRVLLAVPIALAARDFVDSAILTRGQGQGTFTLIDAVNAAAFIAAPVAVAMILSSRQQRGMRLLGVVDAGMILALVALLGLNGRRGAALAVMVVVLVFATRRKGTNLRALLGLVGVAVFAYVVVTYRTSAAGGRTTLSTTAVLLRDLGSVAFTTGGTDRLLDQGSHLGGASIIAGLVRQMPSPIANQILGPPVDTGAYLFRQLTGLTDTSQGYGYSLPAEGVLNFGAAGAFMVPFAAGLVLAWLYGRFDLHGSTALQLLYPIAVGTVPFAWRSDTLGAVKGVLYPALILWGTLVAARTFAAANARAGRARERQRAPAQPVR